MDNSAPTTTFDPVPTVAQELQVPRRGAAAVIELLSEGNTIPFIARYRKEATGGLDEVQIRAVEERWNALVALEKRREAILESISAQGALTPELERQIRESRTLTALEDLYLPFRPKRKTRASTARAQGLQPLADRILAQPASGNPQREAAAFVNVEAGVKDAEAALAGARDIAAEAVSERAEVRAAARRSFAQQGVLRTTAIPKAIAGQRTRFEDYYEFSQELSRIPSHRYLAIERGEEEGVLRVRVEVDEDRLLGQVLRLAGCRGGSPFAEQFRLAVEDGYRRLLAPAVEKDVRTEARERSDLAAVEVFSQNLRNLLLAPPLGGRPVLGIDPGFRTGCKCAAVDATGRFLGHLTLYPHTPGQQEKAARDLVGLVQRHHPEAVAIGNGTAGRETETFVRETLEGAGLRQIIVTPVSESGASVYSASELAREEFPDLDLTVRGAISIARRLQDPLAELVKVEPKALGVGQYQHDVPQSLLQDRLAQVVESCVNHVGVELNTASAALLSYVAGIGATTARRIVQHRDEHGPFKSRRQLLDVAGIGQRTFQQAAGFLRLRGAANPLDSSAVHPERYGLVERMAKDLGVSLAELVGNPALVERIDSKRYVGEGVGEPTIQDILAELTRPGRDPRAVFEAPRFREDVRTLEDLKPGMTLQGVVTNVTAFGAFVDIGVHQDGLVHISQLSDRFVRDPHEVARVGQRLQVTVLSVDTERRRISLSARQEKRG